jgi:hypothetical protein
VKSLEVTGDGGLTAQVNAQVIARGKNSVCRTEKVVVHLTVQSGVQLARPDVLNT